MKYVVFFSIIVTFVMCFGFLFPVLAEETFIPSWIKNTAKFWSNGDIGDSEFIAAIQYLIQNNILILESDKKDGFIKIDGELFTLFYREDAMKNPFTIGAQTTIHSPVFFAFDKKNESIYPEIKNDDDDVVVIFPSFTLSAYTEPGFYTYYRNECDEKCLTVEINHNLEANYPSSNVGVTILALLGYDVITDIDVDRNPSILDKYKKIILLHNEYVTKKIFDAITNHPKVIYLYPNSLYALVDVNYQTNSITLINGHGFPSKEIDNGFNWEFDNTRPDEFNTECNDWKFNEISNGIQLNCYPENVLFKDYELLKKIKDY